RLRLPAHPASLLSYCPLMPATPFSLLALHDALPIWAADRGGGRERIPVEEHGVVPQVVDPQPREQDAVVDLQHRQADAVMEHAQDRKSTRLNSSHVKISYAVFCLKENGRTHVCGTPT